MFRGLGGGPPRAGGRRTRRRGWYHGRSVDRDRVMTETLTAIRRAGAQMILTYWAVDAARLLRDRL